MEYELQGYDCIWRVFALIDFILKIVLEIKCIFSSVKDITQFGMTSIYKEVSNWLRTAAIIYKNIFQ